MNTRIIKSKQLNGRRGPLVVERRTGLFGLTKDRIGLRSERSGGRSSLNPNKQTIESYMQSCIGVCSILSIGVIQSCINLCRG